MTTSESDLSSLIPNVPGAGKEAKEGTPEKRDEGMEKARAAFDALLKKQKEAAGDLEEKVAKKPKKVSKPAPEGEEKAAKAPEPETAPVEAAQPKRDPEIDRLRRKLRLTGTPEKAIESLSDAEVREWWETVEERERSTALALERASKAEKQLGDKQTTAKSEPMGVPTDGPDLEAIARELADQFGEDEAGSLLKALKQLVEPLQEKVGFFERSFSEARERTEKQIADLNRKRLAEKIPSLAENDRSWDIIHEGVLAAIEDEPTKYKSVDAAYDDVFEALYGSVLATGKQRAEEDEAADDIEEVSSADLTPPRTKSRPRSATPEEAAFAAWKQLQESPGDVEGAKRAFNRSIRA